MVLSVSAFALVYPVSRKRRLMESKSGNASAPGRSTLRTRKLSLITRPKESSKENISYIMPNACWLMMSGNYGKTRTRRTANVSVNQLIMAAELSGDMYTNTHSARKSVGTSGERIGESDFTRGSRTVAKGCRKSVGRR